MLKTTGVTIRTLKKEWPLCAQLDEASKAYQKQCEEFLKSNTYIPSQSRYNLTICHEKKFLWFRVAKVCTRTIFNIFKQGQVRLDAEHTMFCHYPPKLFESYFKFAFVRNPWDRLASCWKDKVVESGVDQNYFNFDDSTHEKMKQFESFLKLKHCVKKQEKKTLDFFQIIAMNVHQT